MKSHYEIQGRIIQRAEGAIVRDEVRLSSSDTHDDAARTARAFLADGFTTWIFLVQPGTGPEPNYHLVDTLRPPPPEPGPRPANPARSPVGHSDLRRAA